MELGLKYLKVHKITINYNLWKYLPWLTMEHRVKYPKVSKNTEITKIPFYDKAEQFSFQREIPENT